MMNKLRRLFRAEYWWQPGQLPRRAWRIARRVNARPETVIRLPWGFPIWIDPRESIGRSIVALNTLDLPVTETIWRLLDPEDSCADIGANIGYMVSVMAARLRRGGRITAYEPVPELAEVLRANVRAWSHLTKATMDVRQIAVAASAGTAPIYLPSTFGENRGRASLARAQPSTVPGQTFDVETIRLDETVVDSAGLGLIKIDVEGFEIAVLEGAEKLLRAGLVRDIVLEEYGGSEADSLRLVRQHGYDVFRVTRGWSGPKLRSAEWLAENELDPPTYLATRNAERAWTRFAPRGWKALSGTRA